jgi:hypothetical protein
LRSRSVGKRPLKVNGTKRPCLAFRASANKVLPYPLISLAELYEGSFYSRDPQQSEASSLVDRSMADQHYAKMSPMLSINSILQCANPA